MHQHIEFQAISSMHTPENAATYRDRRTDAGQRYAPIQLRSSVGELPILTCLMQLTFSYPFSCNGCSNFAYYFSEICSWESRQKISICSGNGLAMKSQQDIILLMKSNLPMHTYLYSTQHQRINANDIHGMGDCCCECKATTESGLCMGFSLQFIP